MWTYFQTTGFLFHNEELVSNECFAGQPPFLNNPDGWREPCKGPLPRGKYTIGVAYTHPILGPLTMNLEPDPENDMAGRFAFRIHGWSADAKDFSSQGCICAPRDARELVAASEDRELQVLR